MYERSRGTTRKYEGRSDAETKEKVARGGCGEKGRTKGKREEMTMS